MFCYDVQWLQFNGKTVMTVKQTPARAVAARRPVMKIGRAGPGSKHGYKT